jgi:hypothetical protein
MKWTSLLWHAPGRTWAGMMKAAPLTTWLTAGAAMAWTLMTAWLVVIFKPELRTDQAFWIIESALGIVFVAILAQTGQEISVSLSRKGLNANVGKDPPLAPPAPADDQRSLEGPA